ncbi:MAG: response regulator, partial [Desulfuromonadales bacterium]|nr:response regulator [Desulfuromonadales bacterium]
MSERILVVDDEKAQQDILQIILAREGYEIISVSSAKEALTVLEDKEFEIVLTDLKMQGGSGLELMESLLKENPRQCVIIMTAHGSVDSAVEAIKKGAFD